jgi:hypothetical protein
MKPDPHKALGSAALPTLADSSSIAAVAPGDLSLATQLLQAQLKLHLLTSEHIVLSDGFIYDNPAIWDILDEKLAKDFSSKMRIPTIVTAHTDERDRCSVRASVVFRV